MNVYFKKVKEGKICSLA